MFRRALITGVTGQDGALLAARLLADGCLVTGTHRPDRAPDTWRLAGLGVLDAQGFELVALDPLDGESCTRVVAASRPDAVFHFAGQSSVAASFRDPAGSVRANGNATIELLEAVRAKAAEAHFVLAASAEMFGAPAAAPQDESTPLAPTTPYGVSKLLAHAAAAGWRASFDLRASSAILFNHESEWRAPSFATRKIALGAARIALGREDALALGNIDARRDFGYAPDYVAAMAAMAARAVAADFVLASGRAASIRDFADAAFRAAGLAIDWFGEGVDEVGVERGSDRVRVRIDASLLRPVDAPLLVGDASKARRELGFASTLDLDGIATRMVAADLARERAAG